VEVRRSMKHNHIKAETIVDFILGNLVVEKEDAVKAHLHTCTQCKNECKSWEQMIGEGEHEKAVQASSGLKSRLMKSVDNHPRVKQRIAWNKQAFLFVSLAAFLLLSVGLYHLVRSEAPAYVVKQNDQVMEEVVMKNPNTNRLDITPVTTSNNISGNVWLNDLTDEMLVKVNGLPSLSTKDYQLWIVHTDNEWQGQLLNIRNGSVGVYYKGPDLAQLKFIKVSIEPRGGSEAPTGPDTFFVDFNKDR
jgi:anti-sigma-K factor RskA